MLSKSLFGVGLMNLLVILISAQSAERPDLNGTWELRTAQSELHSRMPNGLTWLIEQTDDSIQLIEREGDKTVSTFRCGIAGKECKAKDRGHAVNVWFYFNGPMLVEVETMGENADSVIKRRFHVASGILTVDVIHVAPEGKEPEKLVLSKAQDARPAVLSATSK